MSIPVSVDWPCDSVGSPTPVNPVTLSYGDETVASGNITYNRQPCGEATIRANTTGLPAGTYNTTLNFKSDGVYTDASTPVAVTILAAHLGTSTLLSVTPATIVPGQNVTLGAVVTPQGTVTPTGQVKFAVGSQVLATANVVNGNASVTGPATGVSPGTYQMVALYGGDNFNLPSTSAPVSVTVASRAKTTTTLTVQPSTVTRGANALVSATVQSSASITPTGVVTVTADGVTETTLTLHNGTASLSVPTGNFPAGTYSIQGTYGGDNSNLPSTSTAQSVIILNPATVALALSPNPATVGSIVTMTATVTDSDKQPVTGGNVTFSYNGNTLGSGPLNASGQTEVDLNTAGLTTGKYVIQANFGGSGSIPPATGTATLTLQQ